MNYTSIKAINQPTPIGGLNLNGTYIPFDLLPKSIQTLILNPNYLVLVREKQIPNTPGGGRTEGTLWYNKQVLAFTVEDAIRNKKIANKTALPDTIEDASKFNGIPSNVYNITLRSYTAKDWIRKAHYNGKGLMISSKSDNSRDPVNIYEEDVFLGASFATDRGNIAFDAAWFHAGSSENSSSGCIIVSFTRKPDGTLITSQTATQNLNKYLQSIKLVGTGKRQQFAIINLWEFPEPPTIIKTPALVINSETNVSLPTVKLELLPEIQIEKSIKIEPLLKAPELEIKKSFIDSLTNYINTP
jgi:hypothetical protein